MNPKERNKYIIAGVLGVVAVGLFIYQVTRPAPIPQMPDRPDRPPRQTPQQRQAAQTQSATTGGSAFMQAELDIDQLLASVEEVDFNYDLERLTRNPMTPLIGTSAGVIVSVDDPTRRDTSPALAIARSMVITGIVYDSAEPMAVLDNKAEQLVEVVGIGHEFPIGILVESIEESRVVLRVGDMRIPKLLEEQ